MNNKVETTYLQTNRRLASSPSANNAVPRPQSAALRGARTAFNPHSPKSNTAVKASGTNGAMAAAMKAGAKAGASTSLQPFSAGSNPIVAERRSGRHPSIVQDRIKRFEREDGLQTPNTKEVLPSRSPSRSPSHIAAQLASARTTPQLPSKPRLTTRNSSKGPEISVSAIARRADDLEYSNMDDDEDRAVAPKTGITTRAGIAAPIPIRPPSSQAILTIGQSPSPHEVNLSRRDRLSSVRLQQNDAAVIAARSASPPKPRVKAKPNFPGRMVSKRAPAQDLDGYGPSKLEPSGRMMNSTSDSVVGDSVPPERAEELSSRADVNKPELHPYKQETPRVAAITSPTQPTLGHADASRTSYTVPVRGRASNPIPKAQPSYSTSRRSSAAYSPLKEQTTGMTESTLADAIVASSLASSRASSPSKSIPPLPPPRRSIFHHHHHQYLKGAADISRTPSPSKGMKQTLRVRSKSDADSDGGSDPHKRGRKHLMWKHPNKHHEGDRKRWRDQITDRERKRYEGVWAANRGLWCPSSRQGQEDMVLNLVTRDIWSRSRLPPDVLEEVWDLVDRQQQQQQQGVGIGMLSRDEFAVGMWLIDQRLKGRKLPLRVSPSVWASVRHVNGLHIPEHR